MQDKLQALIKILRGKKTFVVAICAIGYGLYQNNVEAVLLGLGLFGLRDGMTTEIAKTIITQRKKKSGK